MNERIRALRDRDGASQGKFGAYFGVTREAVSQWEKGKSRPDQTKLEMMARRFDVSLDWLSGKDQLIASVSAPLPAETSNAARPQATTRDERAMVAPSRDKTLPIYGTAGGTGPGDVFVFGGDVQGYTQRPGMLEGVPGAYAVYVHGDSMEPALHQGWIVWVDPGRPVAPSDDVVIQLKNDEAYVKRLKRRTAKTLCCEQFNPRQPVEYPMDRVRHVHLIVGSTRVRA